MKVAFSGETPWNRSFCSTTECFDTVFTHDPRLAHGWLQYHIRRGNSQRETHTHLVSGPHWTVNPLMTLSAIIHRRCAENAGDVSVDKYAEYPVYLHWREVCSTGEVVYGFKKTVMFRRTISTQLRSTKSVVFLKSFSKLWLILWLTVCFYICWQQIETNVEKTGAEKERVRRGGESSVSTSSQWLSRKGTSVIQTS